MNDDINLKPMVIKKLSIIKKYVYKQFVVTYQLLNENNDKYDSILEHYLK